MSLEDVTIASSKSQRMRDTGLLARDAASFNKAETSLQEALTEYKATLTINRPVTSGVEEDISNVSATEKKGFAFISAVEKDLAILRTEKRRWEQADSLFQEKRIPEHRIQADAYEEHLIDEIAPEHVLGYGMWSRKRVLRLASIPCIITGNSSDEGLHSDNTGYARVRDKARMRSRYILLGRVRSILAQEVIRGTRQPESNMMYISEKVLLEAAGRPGSEMLNIFLDMPKELIPMTQTVVERAASNKAFGVETITRLLDEWASEVKITP